MDFKHFSISDVGRVRKANEDNCGDRMTANGYVFVVCDGMGGHVGGATASQIAVDSILDFFESPVQNIYVGISDAFKFANSQVFQAATQDPGLKGMGTTGTILIINNEGCYIGHVGDSRIYLKSDTKLNRLTKDQSFVQNLVDQGIINDEDAENHPKKNQILEALGIKANVNPVVCDAPIKPKPGDCFLLCSDGLNGMLRDPEIEVLLDPVDIEASCKLLISAANEAGGKDNITAMLVTITQSPYAISEFKHFNPVSKIIQQDTIIEPVIDRGGSNKQKTLMWIGIGAGIALTVFLWMYFASGIFSEKEPQKPTSQNSGNPTVEDSVCLRLEDSLEMFKADTGIVLFGQHTYRFHEGIYQKKQGDNWVNKWGDKPMKERYKEINKLFIECEELYNELPTEPLNTTASGTNAKPKPKTKASGAAVKENPGSPAITSDKDNPNPTENQ